MPLFPDEEDSTEEASESLSDMVFGPILNKPPELTDEEVAKELKALQSVWDRERIVIDDPVENTQSHLHPTDEPKTGTDAVNDQLSDVAESTTAVAANTVEKAKYGTWKIFAWVSGIGCFLILCLLAAIVCIVGAYFVYSSVTEAARIAEQQAAELLEAEKEKDSKVPPSQLNTNRSNAAEFMVVNQANGWANICRDILAKIESDQINDGASFVREWGTQSKSVTDTSFSKMKAKLLEVNENEWKKEDMLKMVLEWELGFRKPLR